MVREGINKASGSSGLVSKMVKSVGKGGINMITGPINQMLIDSFVPAELEGSTIVS